MRTGLLFSGGIDSTAILWWKRPDVAYLVNYGHRAFAGEHNAASSIAAETDMRLVVITADIAALGSGDLAGRSPLEMSPVSEWWPFRNQYLVTLAAMAALADDVRQLMIGTVASDNVHADGSIAFIEAISDLLSLQEGGLTLDAPAKQLTTVNLVKHSGVPLNILRLTHSCHRGRFPCGKCRGCWKHARFWESMRLRGVATAAEILHRSPDDGI